MKTEIGKRIQELRKKAGLTQTQLADSLSISFQAVSKWEQGKALPDLYSLPKLSEAFNVSIDYLITGREFEGHPETKEPHWAIKFFNELISPNTLSPKGEQTLLASIDGYDVALVKQCMVIALNTYVKEAEPNRRAEQISKAVDKLRGVLYNESLPLVKKKINGMIRSLSFRTGESDRRKKEDLKESINRLLYHQCEENASDEVLVKILNDINETYLVPAKHFWIARANIEAYLESEEKAARERAAQARLKRQIDSGFFRLNSGWPVEVNEHLMKANEAIKARDIKGVKTSMYKATSEAMKLFIDALPENKRPSVDQRKELRLFGENVYQWFGKNIGKDDANYIASIAALADDDEAIPLKTFEELYYFDSFVVRLYRKYSALVKRVESGHTI